MIEKKNEKIIRFFLEFMMNKNDLIDFIRENQIKNFSRNQTISNLIELIKNDGNVIITKESITKFARNRFLPHLYDIEFQKKLLLSGKLNGHSWHQAAPSRLHMTIQNWVRAFLSNEISFDDYLKLIEDIAKQEVFILTVANITEWLIVNADNSIIPNLRKPGISDVIINDLPYDVKNTHNPTTCPFNLRENPIKFQEWLFDSGDLNRDLRTSQKAPPYYGYNRIYVIIDPIEKWETNFDYICEYIQQFVKGIVNGENNPHIFIRQKNNRRITIHSHLIIP
ncbi:MAG: hypothetical protein ACP6IY_21040 [Promethearchaeia archaeon]